MTVASAKAYITRMREDTPFRLSVNAIVDEAASWAFLKENEYEFTVQEFKEAQEQVYQDHGITPHW